MASGQRELNTLAAPDLASLGGAAVGEGTITIAAIEMTIVCAEVGG